MTRLDQGNPESDSNIKLIQEYNLVESKRIIIKAEMVMYTIM